MDETQQLNATKETFIGCDSKTSILNDWSTIQSDNKSELKLNSPFAKTPFKPSRQMSSSTRT